MGARELTFEQGLPEPLQRRYRAAAGDEELAVLVSRRTTIELVMRRYVEGLPGAALRSSEFVTSLITDGDGAGRLLVRGVGLEGGEIVPADIVVDAGGRFSPLIEALRSAGAVVNEEAEGCGILYYTRFYRLLPGQGEPPRERAGTTGDLGYLKFAVFPADHGAFSITLAVPEVEHSLRVAVMRPETFDAICALLPGVAPWTHAARAAPQGRVLAMGALESRWRELAPERGPAALGFFLVGDSLVRTNPLFGRGCSFAAIQAHLLRDVLDETADPTEQAQLYSRRVLAELRPYYDEMAKQDRQAARRALNGLDPDHRASLGARLMRRFVQDGLAIAVRRDVRLLREASRAFHMLAPPRAWAARPRTLALALASWARGRRANEAFYPAEAGPRRPAMFAALGLPLLADRDRARMAA